MYRKLKQIDDSALLKHRVWRGEKEKEGRKERMKKRGEKRRIKEKIMSSC